MMNSNTPEGHAVYKRRKLRKGTHSCQDCRRRKVKCLFDSSNDTTCIVCQRRGVQCISQDDSSMEGNAIDSRPIYRTIRPAQDVTPESSDDVILRDEQQDISAPHSTIAFVTGGQARTERPDLAYPRPSTGTSRAGHQDAFLDYEDASSGLQAHEHIRNGLLLALPCATDISILSKRVGVISAVCYKSGYNGYTLESGTTPKDQIPIKSLLLPERHPVLLARQMLVFAAATQHISPEELVPGLTRHQSVIIKDLAEAAIRLANMDDVLLGSLEGMENSVFEIFYHLDNGNLRRAWIATRRAATAAQMLGLYRPGHYRFTRLRYELPLDPEIIWSTIVSLERLLSLLLGFPTSTGNMTLTCQSTSRDSSLGHNLNALVGSLAAKILERNLIESAQAALEMTKEIDHDIIIAGERMPPEFWRPLAFSKLDKDSLEALMETRRAMGHTFYYTLVVQLHLPHMLSPHDLSQRVYSKIACVNASREILTREIELRTFHPVSAYCRMSEFLALIAGMAMMLGYITSHYGNERVHLLSHQRLGDRAIVKRALECIGPMSDGNEDVFAVRCSSLLRDLLAIEEEAAEQHSKNSHQGDHRSNQSDVMIVNVPYLGSIQISGQGVSHVPVEKARQGHSPSEGLTIGGIGSMTIERLQVPTPSTFPNIHDHAAASPGANNVETLDRSKRLPAAFDATLDQHCTGAAANIDDWVFQGVDTAFMESLMRGSAIPWTEDFNSEAVDINGFP